MKMRISLYGAEEPLDPFGVIDTDIDKPTASRKFKLALALK